MIKYRSDISIALHQYSIYLQQSPKSISIFAKSSVSGGYQMHIVSYRKPVFDSRGEAADHGFIKDVNI